MLLLLLLFFPVVVVVDFRSRGAGLLAPQNHARRETRKQAVTAYEVFEKKTVREDEE